MTDVLIVIGLALLLVPLLAVSPFVYAPAVGVVCVVAAALREVGEKR